MSKNWYSCESLWTFSFPKQIFILRHLALLESGIYPPNPTETGYTDYGIRIQQSANPNAYFVKSIEIAAELTARMKMCGLDGEIVRRIYVDDIDMSVISKEIGEDYGKLWKRVNRAMSFCAGVDRKYSYENWH